MTPLIIYHANCADGFGAAWAAWKKFGSEAEYLALEYNDPRVSLPGFDGELTFPAEVNGRDIYLFDISLPAHIMAHLELASASFTWRDHHKTAFEAYRQDPNVPWSDKAAGRDVLLHPSKSGCVLAWELFHGSLSVPFFLRLIEDRDLGNLWRPEGASYPATRDFSTGLRSEPFTFENFDCASECWIEIADTGRGMNRLYDQQVSDLVENRHLCRLYPNASPSEEAVFAVNCPPQFASDVGHKLAELTGTFGVTWFINADGIACISLRSLGAVDVSAIAKKLGGGGHRTAAGFKTAIFIIDHGVVAFWGSHAGS